MEWFAQGVVELLTVRDPEGAAISTGEDELRRPNLRRRTGGTGAAPVVDAVRGQISAENRTSSRQAGLAKKLAARQRTVYCDGAVVQLLAGRLWHTGVVTGFDDMTDKIDIAFVDGAQVSIDIDHKTPLAASLRRGSKERF